MISTIKELITEIFDKMQYLFIVLTFFCLFITLFSMPETIIKHPFINFLFPDKLLDNSNLELGIYFVSFYGFLWLVFFVMASIDHYFPIFFLNSIFKLKRILEKIGTILMFIIEYAYIFSRVKDINIEIITSKIAKANNSVLFSVGIIMSIVLLGFSIVSMIYTPIED